MNRYRCLIKKDIKECLRTGKLILFLALSFGIAFMILGITVLFTNIPDELSVQLPGFDIESLEDMMSVIYPKMTRGSLGVFSYYIGVFFTLIIVIVTHSILPKERTNGKWILPIEQGYEAREIVASKTLVYSTFAGCSVFISYMFYFFVASTFMLRDMPFVDAFSLALIHGLNLFFILANTMLLSVCFRSGVVAAISTLGTVLFVPDIMNYMPIGKYFPTYMLTFVYDTRSDYGSLVGPLILNILVLIITYYWAVIRVSSKKTI